jgi:Fe-S-cluster containining protein
MIDQGKALANRKAREEKKKAHLQAMFIRHCERLRADAGSDALTLARAQHDALDAVITQDHASRLDRDEIRCRKGCDHCCKGPVEVTTHEAALLLDAAARAGIVLDRALIARQSQYDIGTWRSQPSTDRACIFLAADGTCKVYAARPNACRKHFVSSEPALCDADTHPADAVSRWMIWEAEVMQAAAVEVYGTSLLPHALASALQASADAEAPETQVRSNA